ncbi:hypothetical protein BS78_08G008500 [Paspalum vaginatum]|nr:hypothetical protein BS78_08G008500 [Paspalum vaginatum]
MAPFAPGGTPPPPTRAAVGPAAVVSRRAGSRWFAVRPPHLSYGAVQHRPEDGGGPVRRHGAAGGVVGRRRGWQSKRLRPTQRLLLFACSCAIPCSPLLFPAFASLPCRTFRRAPRFCWPAAPRAVCLGGGGACCDSRAADLCTRPYPIILLHEPGTACASRAEVAAARRRVHVGAKQNQPPRRGAAAGPGSTCPFRACLLPCAARRHLVIRVRPWVPNLSTLVLCKRRSSSCPRLTRVARRRHGGGPTEAPGALVACAAVSWGGCGTVDRQRGGGSGVRREGTGSNLPQGGEDPAVAASCGVEEQATASHEVQRRRRSHMARWRCFLLHGSAEQRGGGKWATEKKASYLVLNCLDALRLKDRKKRAIAEVCGRVDQDQAASVCGDASDR